MPSSYPLSIEQAHIFSLGAADRRRVQAHVARPDGIDLAALGRAAETLCAHHEILRTTYVQPVGLRVAHQEVHDTLAPTVRADDRPLDEVLAGEWDAPWDLAGDSPLRVVLAAHDVALTLPALAVDRDAAGALARELVTVASGGAPASDDPLQYADYAAWQAELADDPTADKAREMWSALAASYAVPVPFQREVTRASVPVAPRECAIDVDFAAARAVASRYGHDAATLLAACWHAFAARVADDSLIGIATWFDGRGHEETDGAVGVFGRYGPVTIDLVDDPTVAEVLDMIARAHDDGREIADHLLPSDLGVDDDRLQLAFAAVPAGVRGATDELAVELVVAADTASIVYDARALDDDTATRLAAQLTALVADALHDPDARVSRLALLDAAERERLLRAPNETSRAIELGSVLEGFERRAATHPDRPAVDDGRVRLSYGELDARATAIGAALRDAGVAPGAAVGLCADRSAAMLAGLLGIWKAGGAYVPLNFEHPAARLAHQLDETGARVVVTLAALHERLPDGYATIDLDNVEPADAAPGSAPDDGLAYVMYTSGSTGLPKGVEVTHTNLASYAVALAQRLGLLDRHAADEPLRCATVTAISTDLGNTAIMPALVSGHTVVLVHPDVAMDPNAYAELVARTPIDVLKITPPHLDALLTAGAERVLPRHTLVLGGEASPWTLVDAIRAASTCRILNHYGPTETTVGCCTYDVPDAPPASAPRTVPIGHPIANARTYVVDAHGAPLPIGVPGELWIGGAGVARGYAGQPEQTAQHFRADPFAAGTTGTTGTTDKLYRTGDKARWLPEGELEFLGRVDDQVKIRGYRVEPREIEQVLARHLQVRQTAVVAREDRPGERRLVAYVVADGYPTVESLRATVTAALPDYMAPTAFLLIGALPLTPSGKLDRRALPAPDDSVGDFGRPYVEPRSDTEQRLAGVWCEVLHRDRVGVEDDFFELGGHSLLAAQVVARVRTRFGVELPLHSLFTAPTVAQLAVEIDGLAGGAVDDAELDALLEELSDEEIEQLLRDE
jgi:amino acid adenylation domain-containing protein